MELLSSTKHTPYLDEGNVDSDGGQRYQSQHRMERQPSAITEIDGHVTISCAGLVYLSDCHVYLPLRASCPERNRHSLYVQLNRPLRGSPDSRCPALL